MISAVGFLNFPDASTKADLPARLEEDEVDVVDAVDDLVEDFELELSAPSLTPLPWKAENCYEGAYCCGCLCCEAESLLTNVGSDESPKEPSTDTNSIFSMKSPDEFYLASKLGS